MVLATVQTSNFEFQALGKDHDQAVAALADLRCPECGSTLEVDDACVIEESFVDRYAFRGRPLPRRTRVTAAALCTGCEFCMEIER